MTARLYDRLIDGLAAIAGLIVAGAGLLIVYDVVARNLGGQPPASTVALTEYAMLYFTMAAAPWLVRTKGHIVVEVVYQRFSASTRRVLDRIILVLCVLVSLTFAALAGVLMIEAIQNGEMEIRSLDAPRWVLFAPLTAGFLLMAIEFARLLFGGDNVFASQTDRQETF